MHSISNVANARWLFWILIAAFSWLMVSRLTEIREVTQPLVQGKPEWILIAAILQVFYYSAFAAMFKAAFNAVDIRSRIRDLIAVTLGALFVNVIAPTWGMAGAALYVDDASHRGESPARAAAGTLLAQAADYTAFAFILGCAVIYLLMQNKLESYEIAGTAILIVITCSLTLALVLGLWLPTLLLNSLDLFSKSMNGFSRRLNKGDLLADDWAAKNAADFSRSARAIEEHPRRLALTLAVALLAHLINMASLYALFLAFHQQIELGPVVAGYAMGMLFWNISPVPQGIGLVEGIMVLVYTSLGIHGLQATLVVLAFRGLNFWIPMLLGFFLLRKVEILKSKH